MRAALALALLALASPAAAELGPGHWQAAPDTAAAYVATARAFLGANPAAAFALCCAGAAAFATWFRA